MTDDKRQNTIRFIEATRYLISKDGLEHVSIRKIAQEAGFHNSTIYLYFKDLDQLIMLASVSYFRDYTHALSVQSTKNLTPAETFRAIWELFADSIFKEPAIYLNFFFGKHSDNLKEVLNTYYEIFPGERETFSEEIENMYFGNNINDRSMKLLVPLIGEKSAVTPDNIEMLNDLIISFCQYKLERKCADPSLDSDKLKEQIVEGVCYIAGI